MLLGAPLLGAQAAALAASPAYYSPPKLKTQGTNTTSVAGPGTVVVKVLVAKTGAATVQGIVRSTNHGDDAAALEIAKHSTYRPATRGTVPQTAFYDFTLKFTGKGGGASSATSDAGATGGLGAYERQIRAGNYAGAESGLTAYASTHPTDNKAQLDLGVASAFLNEPAKATDAFDKAGTIPDNYKALAAKAYNDAASERIKNKDYTGAVTAGRHASALAPSPFTYNTLGTAEDAAGDHAAAVADLEKARSLAAADPKFKAAERATIDANLVAAYLGAGKPDDAKPIADEAAKLDPNQTTAQAFFANYYAKSASDAIAAGKLSDAAALYEKAAVAAPSQAAASYINAALTYLKIKPNADNVRAKADADKALALEPDNASANFAAGVALANQPGKTKDALVYLNRADESAKKGSDPALTAAIENVLKQLGGNK